MTNKSINDPVLIDGVEITPFVGLTVYLPDGTKFSISGGDVEFDVVANGTLIITSPGMNMAFPPNQWSTVGRKPVTV